MRLIVAMFPTSRALSPPGMKVPEGTQEQASDFAERRSSSRPARSLAAERAQSPFAAQTSPFTFTQIRKRAAIRCNGFVETVEKPQIALIFAKKVL